MWNAGSFQVVWFITDVNGIYASHIYEKLIKDKPDTNETNRVLTNQNQFFSRSRGVVDGIVHDIRVAPGRVDWFISMHLKNDESWFEKLLPTKQSLDKIQNAISKLDATTIGNSIRLSVVSTLLNPVGTMNEVSRELVNICQIPLEPDGLIDFSFQANRKTKVANGVEINRLTKFSAVIEDRIAINIDNPRQYLKDLQNDVRYAVQAVLDFNTVPSKKEFNISEQNDIFYGLLEKTAASADPDLDIFSL